MLVWENISERWRGIFSVVTRGTSKFYLHFGGTMKRISRKFHGDLSGNRSTKVGPRRSSSSGAVSIVRGIPYGGRPRCNH